MTELLGAPRSGIGSKGVRMAAYLWYSAWVVGMTGRRETGVYNAVGPERALPMRDLLATCRAVSGSDATFTWVSDAFLEKHGLKLPLAHPEDDAVDSSRAQAHGLTFRPLSETVRDVLSWNAPPEERDSDKLPPEREAELLREWHSREAPWS